MGMDKPIDNSSRKGYIHPDGTVRNEDLVVQKPEEDENGKYHLIAGKKRYVEDLVETHFNAVKAKPSADNTKKDPFYSSPAISKGKANANAGDPEPAKKPAKTEEEEVEENESAEDEMDELAAQMDAAEESDEPEAEEEPEPEPAEEPDVSAEDTTSEDEVSSDDEIQMISELFQENQKYTYAEIMGEMHKRGYKVTRNQIAEGKRQAGLLD